MEYDPDGQLAWLVSELQAAETAGQRVFVIGHMPFGTNDALHDGSNYLGQILGRYDATIAALFFGESVPFFFHGMERLLKVVSRRCHNTARAILARRPHCYNHLSSRVCTRADTLRLIGHTHKDEFEIGYSNYAKQSFATANSMSYIAPALTPTSGSPAFRIYSLDPVTFGVLDFTEYSTSLESSTYQSASGPVWAPYYSAKATYGPLVTPPVTTPSAELSPAFWHNVTTAFEANDTAFQEYVARKSRGWGVSSCTGDCKTDEICQLRAAEAQYNCATVSPGIDFKRDEAQAKVKESECHGSKVAEMLRKIAKRVA